VDFGTKSLSHPLIVAAARDAFVPVCIYNNVAGADADVLARFGEPAWNNPVVRYVDAAEKDLLPRRDGLWTLASLARRMVLSLEAAGRDVPGYLRLLADEEAAAERARAVFVVHCFWEGEERFGAVPGVLSTRAGFHQGREVVTVEYDAARLDRADLDRTARAAEATPLDGDGGVEDAPAADQAHALGKSPLRFVPMTPLQRTRVNAEVAAGRPADPWLSPDQRALATRIQVLELRHDPRLQDLVPPVDPLAWDAYAAELNASDPKDKDR